MVGAVLSKTPSYGFNKIRFDVPGWHTLEYDNWTLIDSLLSTIAGLPSTRGTWENATAYIAGERVIDALDGSLWRVLVTHTSAPTPTTFTQDRIANPTYWQLENSLTNNRGNWVTATSYAVNDIVRVANAYYVCIVLHTSGVFATDLAANKWSLIFDADAAIDQTIRWDIVQALSAPGKTQAQQNLGLTTAGIALATAANAAAQRTALGATTAGSAVFTAADAAAQRTVLGATAAGSSIFTAADAAAQRTALGASAVGTTLFTAADAAAQRSALVVPVLPTASTGVIGELSVIATGTAVNIVLPAGGTWAAVWFAYAPGTGTIAAGQGTAVAAGGTIVRAGIASTAFVGFQWRIA